MSARAGGVRPWVVQRLSAIYMVLILSLFLLTIVFGDIENYAEWHVWFTLPVWNTAVIVFWLALFSHAWIGIRDVVMDYISHDGLRFSVLGLLGFYLIAMAVWMIKIMIMAVAT